MLAVEIDVGLAQVVEDVELKLEASMEIRSQPDLDLIELGFAEYDEH